MARRSGHRLTAPAEPVPPGAQLPPGVAAVTDDLERIAAMLAERDRAVRDARVLLDRINYRGSRRVVEGQVAAWLVERDEARLRNEFPP